jgi:glucosamine 6-phosphate synthetase-like amidotransferase/phosphosugar isomerase protein
VGKWVFGGRGSGELETNPVGNGSTGIGHTRWATHGGPTDADSHPHLADNGRLALIHNGIIENFAPLKAELIAEGSTFESETDTLRGRITDGHVVVPELTEFGDDVLAGIRRIVIVACETAAYAAQTAKYAIEKWAWVSVDVELSHEFR